mmetsp:Transcript_19343/g.74282  ORF Transcript_19343/g.74282 Transcript_19343/m.74282 type:complete len:325 (+) Transcript_19343:144-1118(+)
MSLGEEPAACPEEWTDVVAFPSICATFGLLAAASLAFAVITTCRYNTVSLWSTNMHSDIISNTPWIAYFVAVAVRSTFIALQYAFQPGDTAAVVFDALAIVSRGFVVFALTFALHHQRKFRSSPEDQLITNSREASDAQLTLSAAVGGYVSNPSTQKPLARRLRSLKRYFGILELIYLCIFVAYLAAAVLVLCIENSVTETLFLMIYCLQQIPALILVVSIIRQKKAGTGKEGSGLNPSLRSKVFLTIAALCALVDELPITGWGRLLPDDCVFYIASWNDLVHLVYGLSLVFFFLFLRSEYLRNVEQCIWKTVSRMQDRFDFDE